MEKITYVKYCPNVFVAKAEQAHQKGEIISISTRRGNEHECEVHNFLGNTNDGHFLYSVTRTDGTNKAAVAARRAEHRLELAVKQREKSSEYFEKSQHGLPEGGEPIKVGHHSEKSHRNALERSHNNMMKSVEASEMAKEHLSKAEYWDRKSYEITLDMPESLEHFKQLLETAKEYHEGLKSGKYPREHGYSLTYAKKRVNELQQKVDIATRLWA